jgi:hypothetical protein
MRGGQFQLLALASELHARGVEQVVLARGELLARAQDAGLNTQAFTAAAVYKAFRAADLVHAHDARSHSICVLEACSPLVVARRVAFPVRTSLVSRVKYRRATHFIAVSEAVKSELTTAGVPAVKVSVVHDGVRLPDAPAWSPSGPIVAPATSDPMKGSDLVRRAAALAGVEVRFTDTLERDIRGASLFVYISRQEGLGSALLLAMAHGIPVIASATGGISEAVEHEVTGLLTSNDDAGIAAAITRLRSNDSVARAFSEAGRRRVAERFTIGHAVEGTLQVYRKVLAQ